MACLDLGNNTNLFALRINGEPREPIRAPSTLYVDDGDDGGLQLSTHRPPCGERSSRVLAGVKQMLGRSTIDSVHFTAMQSLRLTDLSLKEADGTLHVCLGENSMPVREIVAYSIRDMLARLHEVTNESDPDQLCATVPINCPTSAINEYRQLLQDAIPGATIVFAREPYAAILNGIPLEGPTKEAVVVIDMGHGTFDLALIVMDRTDGKVTCQVIFTHSSNQDTGMASSMLVLEFINERIRMAVDRNFALPSDRQKMAPMYLLDIDEADQVKQHLTDAFQRSSAGAKAKFSFMPAIHGSKRGALTQLRDLDTMVTVAQFDKLFKKFLAKLSKTVKECLATIRTHGYPIPTEFVLVGGGMRGYKVRECIQEAAPDIKYTGQKDPMSQVALGGILYIRQRLQDGVSLGSCPISPGVSPAGSPGGNPAGSPGAAAGPEQQHVPRMRDNIQTLDLGVVYLDARGEERLHKVIPKDTLLPVEASITMPMRVHDMVPFTDGAAGPSNAEKWVMKVPVGHGYFEEGQLVSERGDEVTIYTCQAFASFDANGKPFKLLMKVKDADRCVELHMTVDNEVNAPEVIDLTGDD